jgi:hypothetical protein
LGVDEVLRERLREKARLRVAPLAPAAVIGQFESLLRQLAEENPDEQPVAIARI